METDSNQQLNLEEFSRILTRYAGLGMRIEFVPDDQLHRRPPLELREPRTEDDSEDKCSYPEFLIFRICVDTTAATSYGVRIRGGKKELSCISRGSSA